MATATTMKDHALAYAKRGWLIFPLSYIKDGVCSCPKGPKCDRPGKHPNGLLAPNGLHDASCQEAQVESWWTREPNSNIGMQTGENTGIVVMDIDGQDGFITLQDYDIPETVRARSGRGADGLHVYFMHPGEPVKSARILKGIDTRGEGGYIILPPSNHASGNTYEWIDPPGSKDFAKCPQWLLDAASDNRKKKQQDDDDDDNDEPLKVTEGRNIFLTTHAGHLRRFGMRDDVLLDALMQKNEDVCDPPLDFEEVERIAQNAMKWDSGPDVTPGIKMVGMDDTITDFPDVLTSQPRTDTGNAECFVELFGRWFRYVPEKGKWFRWVGSHWAEDDGGAATRAMIRTMRVRHQAASRIQNKVDRVAMWRHCEVSENSGKLNAALAVAGIQEDMSARITDFDANKWILGAPNGTIDLTTRTLRDAEPEDMISRIIDTPFDPDAKAPQWEKFVAEIFGHNQEIIEYVQRALGYCLTGDMREQSFFICYGTGANGKSTFLGVIRKLFGDYAGTVPFESFDADNRGGVGNDIAGIRGKRFVNCIEAEHSRKLAEARVKTITAGNDAVSCRFLYGEFFEYYPQYKLWLAVNHKPIIRGDDRGIWRRIHLIPFEQSFEGQADDKNLSEKLMSELPGILNWCLDGLSQWMRTGLNKPEKISSFTEEYRAESDQIGRWLEERMVQDPKSEMILPKAFGNYKSWAVENGDRFLSNTFWVQRMKDRGFKFTKFGGNTIIHGLREMRTAADMTSHENLGNAAD